MTRTAITKVFLNFLVLSLIAVGCARPSEQKTTLRNRSSSGAVAAKAGKMQQADLNDNLGTSNNKTTSGAVDNATKLNLKGQIRKTEAIDQILSEIVKGQLIRIDDLKKGQYRLIGITNSLFLADTSQFFKGVQVFQFENGQISSNSLKAQYLNNGGRFKSYRDSEFAAIAHAEFTVKDGAASTRAIEIKAENRFVFKGLFLEDNSSSYLMKDEVGSEFDTLVFVNDSRKLLNDNSYEGQNRDELKSLIKITQVNETTVVISLMADVANKRFRQLHLIYTVIEDKAAPAVAANESANKQTVAVVADKSGAAAAEQKQGVVVDDKITAEQVSLAETQTATAAAVVQEQTQQPAAAAAPVQQQVETVPDALPQE